MQPFSLGSAPSQQSPHHCLVQLHSTTLSIPPPMESAMVDDLLRGSRGSSTPFLYLQHHTLMGVFFRYGRFPLNNRCIVHHRNASTWPVGAFQLCAIRRPAGVHFQGMIHGGCLKGKMDLFLPSSLLFS